VSQQKPSLSPRKRAACLRNLRKAWKAPRRKPYALTPARLEACRANLRQAQEANHLRYKSTARRRAAHLANLVKAWATNRRHYRATPARRAASVATIRLAQAAPRAPESYARSRFNHLKHGLTVRTLEETFHLLGENPKELAGHRRLLVRTFAPRDKIERRVVARLAEVFWRRLRLYRAQGCWEAETLRRYLGDLPRETKLSADETSWRAELVLAALMLDSRLYRYEDQFRRKLERLLSYLLRHRAGRDPHFLGNGRMPSKERLEMEEGEAAEKGL
jgi:hypothetical protein